ncbi:MAG: hypothetical protein D6723_04120 [Acidobacteria bacterium]|nr:MAG: hypothetical protein D6723_04120 [Acidobacteriota bacterium]
MPDLVALKALIDREYADIVVDSKIIDGKIRVFLNDESYVDFWWSEVSPERFAHHWNRLHVDGTIYRHDNAPHKRRQYLSTFPKHCHSGREDHVIESHIPDDPAAAIRFFLDMCREMLSAKKP